MDSTVIRSTFVFITVTRMTFMDSNVTRGTFVFALVIRSTNGQPYRAPGHFSVGTDQPYRYPDHLTRLKQPEHPYRYPDHLLAQPISCPGAPFGSAPVPALVDLLHPHCPPHAVQTVQISISRQAPPQLRLTAPGTARDASVCHHIGNHNQLLFKCHRAQPGNPASLQADRATLNASPTTRREHRDLHRRQSEFEVQTTLTESRFPRTQSGRPSVNQMPEFCQQ